MKHATTRNLYAHWNGLRRDRPAPRAGEIAPAELGSGMVDLFLVDLEGVEPRYRFCGSALAMRYGRDLTDEAFLAPFRPEDRAELGACLAHMRADAAGFVAGVTAEMAGGGFATYEILLLPLRGEASCDRAIGSMAQTGGHENRNRVSGRIVAQSLRSVRVLGATADGRPFGPAGPRLPPSPVTRRPHLVLVQGGR